jgi:hypothetical protein
MSSSLYWLPPPKARKENSLYNLKHALSKYLDPEWNGEGYSMMVDKKIIPFLKGLIAAWQRQPEGKANDPFGPRECIKEAESLIFGIDRYGEVEISLHS